MDVERNLAARTRHVIDLDELKHDTLSCLGGARHAGVDPEALRGVVGCAVALGAGGLETYTAGHGWSAGHLTEDMFLEHVDDIESGIVDRVRAVKGLAVQAERALAAARDDLDDAFDDLTAARRALAAAKAIATQDPCDGCHRARAAAIAAAETRIEHAEWEIADCQRRIRVCEGAAAALDRAAQRLKHALARIRAVRPDVAEVYELVHAWRRRQGEKARLADDAREFHTGEGRA